MFVRKNSNYLIPNYLNLIKHHEMIDQCQFSSIIEKKEKIKEIIKQKELNIEEKEKEKLEKELKECYDYIERIKKLYQLKDDQIELFTYFYKHPNLKLDNYIDVLKKCPTVDFNYYRCREYNDFYVIMCRCCNRYIMFKTSEHKVTIIYSQKFSDDHMKKNLHDTIFPFLNYNIVTTDLISKETITYLNNTNIYEISSKFDVYLNFVQKLNTNFIIDLNFEKEKINFIFFSLMKSLTFNYISHTYKLEFIQNESGKCLVIVYTIFNCSLLIPIFIAVSNNLHKTLTKIINLLIDYFCDYSNENSIFLICSSDIQSFISSNKDYNCINCFSEKNYYIAKFKIELEKLGLKKEQKKFCEIFQKIFFFTENLDVVYDKITGIVDNYCKHEESEKLYSFLNSIKTKIAQIQNHETQLIINKLNDFKLLLNNEIISNDINLTNFIVKILSFINILSHYLSLKINDTCILEKDNNLLNDDFNYVIFNYTILLREQNKNINSNVKINWKERIILGKNKMKKFELRKINENKYEYIGKYNHHYIEFKNLYFKSSFCSCKKTKTNLICIHIKYIVHFFKLMKKHTMENNFKLFQIQYVDNIFRLPQSKISNNYQKQMTKKLKEYKDEEI